MKELNAKNMAEAYKEAIIKEDLWNSFKQMLYFGFITERTWREFTNLI